MVPIYDPQGRRSGFSAKHCPQPCDIQLPSGRQRLIYDSFMEQGWRPWEDNLERHEWRQQSSGLS